MNYHTYSPNPLLSHVVKVFWSLEAAASALTERQTIVPDGCMEMIIHYGDLFAQFSADGTATLQPRSFVFGQVTRMLEIAPTGRTGIIAARFHPDGFAPFLNAAIQNFKNRAVPLLEMFGELGRILEQDVLLARSNREQIEIIEHFLISRLPATSHTDTLAKLSVEALIRSKGQLTVAELAEQIEVNRRMLERKFSAVIGLSPKQLSKILRLQATLKALEQKQFADLTALALENGYFDQAHFIKDFKEFTGLSPKKFYANSLALSAFFISTE